MSITPALDEREFNRKRVLVTGGTKGAGKAMAHRFLRGGGSVIITARSAPEGKTASDFVQADIATPEGAKKVIREILDHFKGIGIIVHNVGGLIGSQRGLYQRHRRTLAAGHQREPVPRRPPGPWTSAFHDRTGLRRDRSCLVHSTNTAPLRLDPCVCSRESCPDKLQQGIVERGQPKGVLVVTVSPGVIETDAAIRMIQRMADKDNSNYAETRQKLMVMLGGIPLGRPRPAGIEPSRLIYLVSA